VNLVILLITQHCLGIQMILTQFMHTVDAYFGSRVFSLLKILVVDIQLYYSELYYPKYEISLFQQGGAK
jgi:hypothetical protein